jgi:hypothetical protein
MSEAIREQVEDAIARNLHLGAPPKAMSIHGMHWHYPVEIAMGDIVMRDSDCGLAKPTWTITTEEWERRVRLYGLWKKVGMWSFVPADDPAAAAIALCERDPHVAGRELHRLRMEAAGD